MIDATIMTFVLVFLVYFVGFGVLFALDVHLTNEKRLAWSLAMGAFWPAVVPILIGMTLAVLLLARMGHDVSSWTGWRGR